jgi:hypothetical protein
VIARRIELDIPRIDHSLGRQDDARPDDNQEDQRVVQYAEHTLSEHAGTSGYARRGEPIRCSAGFLPSSKSQLSRWCEGD